VIYKKKVQNWITWLFSQKYERLIENSPNVKLHKKTLIINNFYVVYRISQGFQFSVTSTSIFVYLFIVNILFSFTIYIFTFLICNNATAALVHEVLVRRSGSSRRTLDTSWWGRLDLRTPPAPLAPLWTLCRETILFWICFVLKTSFFFLFFFDKLSFPLNIYGTM